MRPAAMTGALSGTLTGWQMCGNTGSWRSNGAVCGWSENWTDVYKRQGLAFVIETLSGSFPFATSMAFLGLILGGIPALLRRADFRKNGLKKYMTAVTVFCLMTVVAIAEGGDGTVKELVFDSAAKRLLTMGCVGMVASVTMVVPGVSGTMLLMMMGYYQPVLHAFNLVQTGVLTGDWQTCLLYTSRCV